MPEYLYAKMVAGYTPGVPVLGTFTVLGAAVLLLAAGAVRRLSRTPLIGRAEETMLTSIAGRSVVVTGASKGIGKGIARVFARQGAKVLVVARTGAEAEATAAELGHGASAFAADVTKLADMEAMAAAAAERHGGIDILCANAGIFPQAKIEDMTAEQWDEVMGTNLKGTFLAVKACLPALSKLGPRPHRHHLLDHRPDHRLSRLDALRRLEGGPARLHAHRRDRARQTPVTVNAVMPGNIMTEGLDGLGEDYLKTMAASIPLKRLGSVEDIGNAALFFASKEAAYITGQTIVVDGGQILPESLTALKD